MRVVVVVHLHCNSDLRSTAASKNAPPRDYSLEPSDSTRVFNAFTSISIIASIYGNGILPEIQVTSSCY